MAPKISAILCAAALASGAATGAEALTYTLTELTVTGGRDYLSVIPIGINNAGQILGRGYTAGFDEDAIVWNGNSVGQVISPAGSSAAMPSFLNSSGQVVGTAKYAAGQTQAFVYDIASGSYSNPAGFGSTGTGINNQGQVVGNIGANPYFYDPVLGLRTYDVPESARTVTFEAITNSGFIIGGRTHNSTDPDFTSERDIFVLNGPNDTLPTSKLNYLYAADFQSLNGDYYYYGDQLLGSPFSTYQTRIGSVNGAPPLPNGPGLLPGDTNTYGGSFNSNFDFVAESYSEGRNGGGFGDATLSRLGADNMPVTYRLADLVVNLGDYFLQQGSVISDSGLIAGIGRRNNQVVAFLLTPTGGTRAGVPEPVTWALMLVGFGATGAALRRRRAVHQKRLAVQRCSHHRISVSALLSFCRRARGWSHRMRLAAFAAAALLVTAIAAPASANTTIIANDGWTPILTQRDGPTFGAPFTFTVASNSVLTFLDCCIAGDTFKITGDLSGETTFYAGAADAFGATGGADYSARWGSADFSKLLVNVSAGSYTFDVASLVGINNLNEVDVRLDTAAVPEPAGWALMIGGFGVAGVTLRRRRAALA